MSRAYHALNTRYNVLFNGAQSYQEGLVNIEQANQDDYSTIIPMYPISNHANTSAATGNMDKTIEKSRKAIKLHSIKQKPKRNHKKWNDPKYRQFYEQHEFNPELKNAWLLLAKAEFHKGDFLGSVGTFAYVAKHYSNDNDMVVQCQLWMVRAYAEMGWLYEAEEVLSKINQDLVSLKNTGLYAAVNADLLLKRKQYAEALPLLELALSKEKDKTQVIRFNYLLGQLYQQRGDNSKAYEYYTRLIRKNPPFELDFNARLNRIQLNHTEVADVRKELKKMIKNSNNKDYLDQLYYALGNTYLQHGDTATAIENYIIAADTSRRDGIEKAIVLVTLGDLYYQQKKYVKAHPTYDEAAKILPNTNDDYSRVSRLSETLGELVSQHQIVVLQDSLLYLSTLSSEQQLSIVNKIIENLIAEEKAVEERALAKENIVEEDNIMPIGLGMPTRSADWYFYNPNLMRTGQAEFQRQWGKRKLEDNWRRASKANASFAADENTAETTDKKNSTELSNSEASLSDNKKPEFYLRQIPVTDEQKATANAQIAEALFEMGLIYKDKIEDFEMAEETFNEFIRRYGQNERIPDAYFQQFILFTKNKDAEKASIYRARILSEYPETRYAQILYYEDYTERFARMFRDQDSIYSQTYKAYSSNDFPTVFENVEYMQKEYPLSTLMPKFLFLNALSVGKTDTPENFETVLSALVEAYPTSDVSAMAKDIIALIRQGQESKTGTSHGTLLTRREENAATDAETRTGKMEFSTVTDGKHRLMLLSSAPDSAINQLMYQVASYNFSRFMIKEFDMVVNQLDSIQKVLSITNFESYNEVAWYQTSIKNDVTLSALFQRMEVEMIIISETNFGMLRVAFTLDDYLQFQQKIVEMKVEEKVRPPKKQEEVVVQIAEIAKPVVAPQATGTETETETSAEEATSESQTTQEAAQPEEEQYPIFKNLYVYQPNQPHHVVIYMLSGTVNFDVLKTAFDLYNSENYGMLNLNIAMEKTNGRDVIIIGSFTDAEIAKSYFLRMVNEKQLFEGIKNANYRNLLGTQKNLNVMMQQKTLNVYFEFMREYYLK